ncbi:MAG: hypothetical protein FJ035_07960 [Chloroflexi bacterium]|nr:hypothetical protein [Chloroflexota bacterium]
MAAVVPIQSLTVAALREVLREALLDEGAAVVTVTEFVARIEWSPSGVEIDRGVRALLAEIEALTTLFEDGDVELWWYVETLRGLVGQA